MPESAVTVACREWTKGLSQNICRGEVVVSDFVLFLFFFFETGFDTVASAGLELSM